MLCSSNLYGEDYGDELEKEKQNGKRKREIGTNSSTSGIES